MREIASGNPEPPDGVITNPPTGRSSCETKPIRTEWQKGQVLCGKRVMTNLTPEELRRNKANCEGRAGGFGLFGFARG